MTDEAPTNPTLAPEGHNTQASATENDRTARPICCRLDLALGKFEIVRAKGKALSSGGFGFSMAVNNGNECDTSNKPSEVESTDLKQENCTGDVESGDTKAEKPAKPNTKTLEFLFVEEVIFLHERGLLECLAPQDDKKEETNDGPTKATLDSSQLYQLLPKLGLSLPTYLVYAHLRSQDFRVLRHDPDRLEFLKRQSQNMAALNAAAASTPGSAAVQSKDGQSAEGPTTAPSSRKEANRLRLQVRDSIANAAPPTIPKTGMQICWDCYQPNSQFSKTRPGLPAFYVAVTFFNEPRVSFPDIQSLESKFSQGIPLKIACVSDSGTVLMFGVTAFGVPTMKRKAGTSGNP